METKIKDIKYTEHTKFKFEDVQFNIKNLTSFMYFIYERYFIHIQKDIKKANFPWTGNPILQKYRFTNVRREHDKQTQELLNRIVNNKHCLLTLEDKIANIFIFRGWNNYKTFEKMGLPYTSETLYDKNTIKAVKHFVWNTIPEKEQNETLWYSNAYNQGGCKQAWSRVSEKDQREEIVALRPFNIGPMLKQKNIIPRMLKSSSQLECFNIIKEVKGFKDFLAYQIFVDCTYIPEFPFSENEFVVAGPGCQRGLHYIIDNADDFSPEALIFCLRDNWNKLLNMCGLTPEIFFSIMEDLPLREKRMNVMSIENCLCEYSKYHKAKYNLGRPRNLYNGGKYLWEK